MSRSRCLELRKQILDGHLLAIDPTSGSVDRTTGKPSEAGWATFRSAVLLSSGVITIPENKRKEARYRDILTILQEDFPDQYDVLALEDIPLARRRGNFNTSQTLIQVCGVYIAGTTGDLVEIASHTWQAVARRIGGWEKGDESDAQYIGLAAIAFASGYSQTLSEKKKLEFIGALVHTHKGWNMPGIINHWNLGE